MHAIVEPQRLTRWFALGEKDLSPIKGRGAYLFPCASLCKHVHAQISCAPRMRLRRVPKVGIGIHCCA
jgi:hypothetical protein